MDIFSIFTTNSVGCILSVIPGASFYDGVHYTNGTFTSFTNIRHYLFIPKKAIQIEYI